MINQRNKNNVKDGINTYLKGGKWKQWTDFGGETLEEAKRNIQTYKSIYPECDFIARKQKAGFYRIYYCE